MLYPTTPSIPSYKIVAVVIVSIERINPEQICSSMLFFMSEWKKGQKQIPLEYYFCSQIDF